MCIQYYCVTWLFKQFMYWDIEVLTWLLLKLFWFGRSFGMREKNGIKILLETFKVFLIFLMDRSSKLSHLYRCVCIMQSKQFLRPPPPLTEVNLLSCINEKECHIEYLWRLVNRVSSTVIIICIFLCIQYVWHTHSVKNLKLLFFSVWWSSQSWMELPSSMHDVAFQCLYT